MASTSFSRSWKYDVFLSFRGEDTRKTFVDHLYSALVERLVCTYKDDETLSRGDTISPSLFKAIQQSQIAIVVFSKNYAHSAWCLDELEYIMKCRNETGQTVIPVFYEVEPSQVRYQKGEFGKAFSKHKETKIESWEKALVDASNIAGWEPKHIANGHEAKCIKDIVCTILDKLISLNSTINENLVGIETRLQDLKRQLKIGSGGVSMVGIWGIGGGGKTTLASSLYIKNSSEFDSCCFVDNIQQAGLKTSQEKILSTILKMEVKVSSVDIGKHMIKSRLCRRNVLIVLDDVDDRKQLEALAGSHDWFGDGSRIIITTRDEHLLITHRVDRVSHVSLLLDEEAMQLFNRHAYNKDNHVEDYKMLSQRVVTYAGGLPLALIVLGSFLYGKDRDEWISTLDRLKYIPEMEIVEKLKISYDGLKPLEKELFLDIACFFRRDITKCAMGMLEACGFHPRIGVKVLIQKALITVNSNGEFDMHDLVQEMGHYIVRGGHPNSPEKHTRLWQSEAIEDMCSGNMNMDNNITEAIICDRCPSGFGRLISKAKKLRLLSLHNFDETDTEGPDFLSNELRYMFWVRYPASTFPESFKPRKLVVMKLHNSLQKELWMGYKSLPCLKELELHAAQALVTTPDFGGLTCLQKLTLMFCDKLREIHPSLGYHSSIIYVYVNSCKKLRKFPNIVRMEKLEILDISLCEALSQFPNIESNMDSLLHLSLKHVGIKFLPSTVGKYCTGLKSLKLENCLNLKSVEGNFHALKRLQECKIRGGYKQLIKLPKDLFNENIHLEDLHLYSTRQPCIFYLPRFLRRLTLSSFGSKEGEILCDIGELSNLEELDLSYNRFSRFKFSLSQLSQLKLLNLEGCCKLLELPQLPSNIAILKADHAKSLEFVGDISSNCKWLCQVSLRWVRSVTGGYTLLQSMLHGNTIRNGFMSLQLKGLEIPKVFIPYLVKGRTYRLQLPENWFNDFSGFLMYSTLRKDLNGIQYISIKHAEDGSTSMDCEQDVYWEESVEDVETWVGYISFGSLKTTAWWDQTSTSVEFFIKFGYGYKPYAPESCTGFGVCLVPKTTETETTTTNCSSEDADDYKCNLRIEYDSKSHLNCVFQTYYTKLNVG